MYKPPQARFSSLKFIDYMKRVWETNAPLWHNAATNAIDLCGAQGTGAYVRGPQGVPWEIFRFSDGSFAAIDPQGLGVVFVTQGEFEKALKDGFGQRVWSFE
jgi:hypothetical protein